MELPDKEQFDFKECEIAGDKCWLITPKDMATKWDETNFRFRSCIVRQSDNFVVSQGFGKFVNFGERPEFQPWDNSWKFEARHKLDGSLLIVSKYKGELICRTRGTVDARQLPNGHEIDLLIANYDNYPKASAFDVDYLDRGYSLLYEWTTPSNIIVLREHSEPTITLVGAVRNDTCEYVTQDELDQLAKLIDVGRPRQYVYNSIEECILDVQAWEGKEGVVLYSPDGQTLKKIKADAYCELHKMATGITNVNHVLDVFMTSPRFTNYGDFYTYIETTLDYEIAEKCKGYIKEVVDAYNEYLQRVEKIKLHVDKYVRCMDSRREKAVDITNSFNGWESTYAFLYLDNREIDNKIEKYGVEARLKA